MKYIKKIKTKTVETFLGVNLKPNTISIGFDVASYITGVAIIKTSNDYLTVELLEEIKVPKLNKKIKTREMLDNVDLFTEQLDYLKNKISNLYKLDVNRIEDCFLKFGNVRTVKSLARASILVYDRFKRISKDIDLIMPTSARAKIKFKKSNKKIKDNDLKKEIVAYINNALDLDLKPKDENKADAIVLALAGLTGEIIKRKKL